MRRYAHRDDRSLTLDLIPSWLRWAEQQDVAGAYIATWVVFNAIYVAEYHRAYATIKEKDGHKDLKNRYGYGYQMVDVQSTSERDMMQYALKKLPTDFKQGLVTLASPDGNGTCLDFFARRTPFWQGFEIAQDALGQPVRGVINVRETVCREYPRWVPVDQEMLDKTLSQINADANVDVPARLIEQLGDVLYTVRNNLFHGCKGPEDSNDNEVLCNALELLRAIVRFYINWTD